MSKAVMISINPKWVEMILNGKKTIEVRKTAPKLETPFKCYIYCTSVKHISLNEYVDLVINTSGKIDYWHEKVVAEFTCNKIQDNFKYLVTPKVLENACLTETEVEHYLGHNGGYGWHISDLKVYDQPKELSEFRYACRDDHACNLCKYLTVASWDKGNTSCGAFVRRAPQSWCYVEEI